MIYTLTTICGDMGKEFATNNKRTWGFHHSEKKALRAIAKNCGGMDDCMYDYLVLEVYKPGVIAIAEREVWFKWEHPQWVLCEKPDFLEGLISWAMG